MELVRSGQVSIRPTSVSEFVAKNPPVDTVDIRTGAWNIGTKGGFNFSQWDGSSSHPETRQRLAEFSKILQVAIATVRNLSHTLRSTGLDKRGLVSTVRLYCEGFSRRKRLKVDFFSAGIDRQEIGFDTKIILYRIIQEAFNNVKKHANATSVTIRLVGSFPNIVLRIEDNGKGFDVKERLAIAMKEKRMGLRSMEERVALLDGKMRIESRAMRGTKILIEIPIKGKKSGREENRSDC